MLRVLAALTALSLGAVAPGPSVIEMTDTQAFLPKELTVVVGEVVVWKNASGSAHIVNTIPENCRTESGKAWVRIPAGASPFSSGEIRPEDEYRVRFEIPGTYQYVCTLHEGDIARGTVVVQGSR